LCASDRVLYSFTLPMPPSINASYRAGKGRIYKATPVKVWAEEALWSMIFQGLPQDGLEKMDRLRVDIDLTFRDRTSDIDNRLKSILDVVSKHFGFNDSIIYELHVTKRVNKANDLASVRVCVLDASTAGDMGKRRTGTETGDRHGRAPGQRPAAGGSRGV